MKQEILRRLARRPIPIAPRRLATSQYNGEWLSPYKGKGLEFSGHRQYQMGDDLRTVHMATSVRAGKRMVVERISRRDISILIVLDCSASMSVRRKADMLKAVSMMLIYSGFSMEIRTGAALMLENAYYRLGMGVGRRKGLKMLNDVESLPLREKYSLSSRFPRLDMRRLLPMGGILLVVSDFLDERGYLLNEALFSAQAGRYDFIPVIIQDEFEYSFPDLPCDTLLEFYNPETGHGDLLWVGRKQRGAIKNLHRKRFNELQEYFHKLGVRYIHIKEPGLDRIQNILIQFFASR